ncbi:histidine phosphatase family protein [Candidatus Sumerlaeota bacterium]|nr:histidine phosphatase family protein [Candidatus Sumerlaeota bacterium]
MPDTPPTTLFIVRHGETAWNVEQRLQGQLDSPLTDLGRRQAEAVAERLAEENLDVLYSSDLGRAMETARVIADRCGGPEIVPDAGLRERNFGIFNGLNFAEARERDPEAYSHWMEYDYVVPGGESPRQKAERGIAAVETVARRHPGRKIGIVTHGGILTSLLRRVMHVEAEAPHGFLTYNGAVNVFLMENGALKLSTWGDIRHLRRIGTKDDF